MPAAKDILSEYKQKVIISYIEWLKGKGFDMKLLTSARTCIEHILKFSIIKKAKEKNLIVSKFDSGTYNDLRNAGYFSGNLQPNQFTVYHCITFIKNTRIFPDELLKYCEYINAKGNENVHNPIIAIDPVAIAIDKKLFEVVDWFFKNENESDWKQKFISPVIDGFLNCIVEKNADKTQNIVTKEGAKIIEALKNNHYEQYLKIASNILNSDKEEEKTKGLIEKIKRRSMYKKILVPTILFVLGLIIYHSFIKESFRSNKIYDHSIKAFNTSKESYNVLLFPFEPLEKCTYKKTNIENAIISRLLELSERDNLNLRIKFDTLDCIHNYAEADSIGRILRANLVIWGDLFEHCSSESEACLKFVNILPRDSEVPTIGNIGESRIEKFTSLSEVKEGKLQKNIDYIIYWIAAVRAYSKTKFSVALNHFIKIEKSGFSNSELYSYLASCYINLRSPYEARFYFEKALKIDSINNFLQSDYAGLLWYFNDTLGAKKHYEIALKISPDNSDYHCLYANLLNDKFNDKEAAKQHYEMALKISPNNAQAHIEYGLLLKLKFNDNENGKSHYLKAVQLIPEYKTKERDSIFVIK